MRFALRASSPAGQVTVVRCPDQASLWPEGKHAGNRGITTCSWVSGKGDPQNGGVPVDFALDQP